MKVLSKLRTRLLISLFSFICCLAILELGLRLGGYIYIYKLVKTAEINKQDSTPYTIVTIGDSYTVGGEGKWKDNYPSQLQKMLSDSDPKKFTVINGGVCESNSTMALNYLSDLVEEYKIDSVVLLTGATNRFNLIGFSQNKAINFFSRFRLYKLAKIFMINLRWRILQQSGQVDGHNDYAVNRANSLFGKAEEDANKYDIKMMNCQKVIQSQMTAEVLDQELVETYILAECYGANNEDPTELFQRALSLNYNQDLIYQGWGNYLQEKGQRKEAIAKLEKVVKPNAGVYGDLAYLYLRTGKLTKALELSMQGIELFPTFYEFYYLLSKTYELQNKYSAQDILQSMRRIEERNPELTKNTQYQNYLSLFRNKGIMERNINNWLRKDLEKFVLLCKDNNIQLVIQNYPYPYHSVNKYLKEIAKKYDLPFVDNYSVFKNLEPHNKYFRDTDHCTLEGHRIMAENIYKIFARN